MTSLLLVESVRLFSFNNVAFNWHENFVSFFLVDTFFSSKFYQNVCCIKTFYQNVFSQCVHSNTKTNLSFSCWSLWIYDTKKEGQWKNHWKEKRKRLITMSALKMSLSSSFEFYFLLKLHEDYKVEYNFRVLLSVHQRRKENVLSQCLHWKWH